MEKLWENYKKTVWELPVGFAGLGFAGSDARPGPPSWPQT